MPAAVTNLHLGYQPGMTLSASKIWLTCPDGSSLDWVWELEGDEPIQMPTKLPIQPVRPRPASPRTVVATDVSDDG